MEKTALEWFHKETWNLKDKLENKLISIGQYANTYHELFEQAKKKEIEKLEEAYFMGRLGETIKEFNKTFKSE